MPTKLASIICSTALLFAAACGDDGDGTPTPDAMTQNDGGATPDAPSGADAAIVDPLAGIGTPQLLPNLPALAFTEGPVWDSARGVLLLSDIPNSTIQEFTPPDQWAPFRDPSGEANGLFFDQNGLLLAAEHEGRRISRTEAGGNVVTVTGDYMGDAYHSPNDLVVRSDGTIYFTDPPFGNNPAELLFNGVFRVSPGGVVTAEREFPTNARPNGIVLSPNESVLYVADTTGVMYRYDVDAAGALSGETIFNDTDVAGADGMAVDSQGNIWVTTQNGIDVFAPDGTLWGTVESPDPLPMRPSNCAFGGADKRTLYVTARTGVYSISVVVPGL